MSDQRSVAALQQAVRVRQDELAAAVQADHTLSATLADVHRIAAKARRRLEEIGAHVESVPGDRTDAHLDAPGVALATRRRLAANLREIEAVITETAAESAAKAAVLKELCDQYRKLGGSSTS